MNTPKYSKPILSIIFNLLALLLFGAAGVVVWYAYDRKAEVPLPLAGSLVLAGLIYMAISQALHHLALTSYNTGRLVLLAEPNAEPAPVAAAETGYYYSVDEGQEGPFTADGMRQLRDARVIHLATPVMREGEETWAAYAEYPELQ